MILAILRKTAFVLSVATTILQAEGPDIGNLDQCIGEVRHAEANAPNVLTFDSYTRNYTQLMADLRSATSHLPHVYQVVAAEPLIKFLTDLGESQFLRMFEEDATDGRTAALQQIIPDAALAILSNAHAPLQGINAFEEIVSDLYDGFLGDEARAGNQTGRPIQPPTYGIIPPLVKFGNADDGPYTWTGDDTRQLLGMGCGIVSLPPAHLNGGLLAWSALGHETAGHDVLHADEGLLDELARKVHDAVLRKFKSKKLADYWASCLDETASDVMGCLNLGPSAGIGLIGYFRALGDGELSTLGSKNDPHPIDLLRGYLAAAVVKRLHFSGADIWSEVIAAETEKDRGKLYFVDRRGRRSSFPVSFKEAVASTDVVAEAIMESQLNALQGYSLQELQDWTDHDQSIVDSLVRVLQMQGQLPADLQGPGFYAAYVVAAATQAALQKGADVSTIFGKMQTFLATMHLANPTWSQTPTVQSMALVEYGLKGIATPSLQFQ